jgi:hypothetical protein
MAKDFLKVFANPWLHVDHEGRPCCTVEREEFTGRWVGATPSISVKGEVITVGTLSGYLGGEKPNDVVWAFDPEPQTVPNTGYYRDRIKEGALVLVDASEAARLSLTHYVGNSLELVKTGKSALAKDPNATSAQPAPKKGQE